MAFVTKERTQPTVPMTVLSATTMVFVTQERIQQTVLMTAALRLIFGVITRAIVWRMIAAATVAVEIMDKIPRYAFEDSTVLEAGRFSA